MQKFLRGCAAEEITGSEFTHVFSFIDRNSTHHLEVHQVNWPAKDLYGSHIKQQNRLLFNYFENYWL